MMKVFKHMKTRILFTRVNEKDIHHAHLAIYGSYAIIFMTVKAPLLPQLQWCLTMKIVWALFLLFLGFLLVPQYNRGEFWLWCSQH